ncbi:hypothetical protein GCM10007094_23150 [Pseudovibrio japonicus]|uniref:Uncharacterized protein n=1 Tax=Pseudovibrio japonicus TaxID=366534 RepID=A0ABQ3EKK3_9HYPH|nr:hypothetical protein [Pseudovibrio japonicus]GHB33707.1 hypothetical protein GCM10007094_23150 [Pseudovibrio japonicus]
MAFKSFFRLSLIIATPFLLLHAYFQALFMGLKKALMDAALEFNWELDAIKKVWRDPSAYMPDQDGGPDGE